MSRNGRDGPGAGLRPAHDQTTGPSASGPEAMPAQFFSHHETGIDQAQAAVGQNYYMVTSMGLLDRNAPYEFRSNGLTLGALTVGRAWYNAGIYVTMTDLQTCYYINFPQTGRMRADHRGSSLDIGPGRAAVFQAVGDV
ncbi:MAG: hypothetical protein V7646_3887 [Pseudonocardia sp.]